MTIWPKRLFFQVPKNTPRGFWIQKAGRRCLRVSVTATEQGSGALVWNIQWHPHQCWEVFSAGKAGGWKRKGHHSLARLLERYLPPRPHHPGRREPDGHHRCHSMMNFSVQQKVDITSQKYSAFCFSSGFPAYVIKP